MSLGKKVLLEDLPKELYYFTHLEAMKTIYEVMTKRLEELGEQI